jgi:serine/threonine protein kinase
MPADGLRTAGSQTEYRLLKPMPSRHESAAAPPSPAGLTGGWDSHLRRLFPPLKTPAAELLPVRGIVLGHFELEERIGRGGMGSVFRAHDTRLDRLVALKVLSPDQLREPSAVQRFQNEARLAAKLDHENIARVYFVGEDRGVHFIAFEYVRGTTVREVIAQKGTLTPDEAVNYTLQTAEALKQTSAAGLVHRDIKPSNLIVTPSGRLKLVDLGLARTLDPDADQELTVTGTTLGTFDYISPEQARDPRNVDVRSDIYSLGCTLFHMLTGTAPYASANTVDKLVQHSTGVAPDPAERNPRVPPRLSLVVQRMMAVHPDERYATPDLLIEELIDVAEDLGLRATAPEGTIWRKPIYSGARRWDEHRGWLIGLAVIVFLAIAGGDLYRWAQNVRGDLNGDPAAPARQALTQGPTLPEVHAPNGSTPTTAGHGIVGPSLPQPSEGVAPPSVTPSSNGPKATDPPIGPTAAELVAQAMLATPPRVLPIPVPSVTPPATGNAGEPSSESVASDPAPRADRVSLESPFLVTGPDGEPAGRFPTLEAACHAAAGGSVIDIDCDGPLARPQKPVVIQSKRLTIRPALGRRPLLTFVPGDELLATGDLRMIQVNGGSLELLELDVAMQVIPEVNADRWVLISLAQAGQLTLRGATLTAENPGWRDAVLIERRSAGSTPMSIMPATEPLRETEIVCEDCLFRGGAAFYDDRTLEPGSLRLVETAVAVSDSLLFVEGVDQLEMETAVRNVPTLRCSFDHVTVLTDAPLVHLQTGEGRECVEVRVDCRNSILDELSEQPLLLLEGHQHSDALVQRLRWTSSHNVYVTHPQDACLVRGSLPLIDDEWLYSLDQWRTQPWQELWDGTGDVTTGERVVMCPTVRDLRQGTVRTGDLALRPEPNGDGQPSRVAAPTDRSDPGFRPSISSLPGDIPSPPTPP